jgi:hypothetical protein
LRDLNTYATNNLAFPPLCIPLLRGHDVWYARVILSCILLVRTVNNGRRAGLVVVLRKTECLLRERLHGGLVAWGIGVPESKKEISLELIPFVGNRRGETPENLWIHQQHSRSEVVTRTLSGFNVGVTCVSNITGRLTKAARVYVWAKDDK